MFYVISTLHIANIFSGVLVLHYLQTLTPSLALGGELAYQRGTALPGGQISLMAGAIRYTYGNSTFSGSISK